MPSGPVRSKMARSVSDVQVLDQVEIGSVDRVRLTGLPDVVTLPADAVTLPDGGGDARGAGVHVLTTGDHSVHCYGTSNRKVTCHCTGQVLDSHLTPVDQVFSLLCCQVGGRFTPVALPVQSGGSDSRKKRKKSGDTNSESTSQSNEDIFSTLLDSRTAKGANICPTSTQVVYNTSSGSQVSDRCVQNFCVIPNYLVTCSESPKGWYVSVFSHTGEKHDHEPLLRRHVPRVTHCSGSNRECLPRLYAVQPPGQHEGRSQGHAAGTLHLSVELFSALFGVTANLLDCPMILLGLPDGRVCTLPMKDVTGFAKPASAGQLYHLQQPVVSIHAVTLVGDHTVTPVRDQTIPSMGDHNMLVLVGAEGKVVLVRAGKGASGPVFKEYKVPSPILDSDCSNGKLVYSTGAELCVLTFKTEKGQGDKVPGVFPDMLVPQKYDLGQVLKVMVTGSGDDGEEDGLSVLAVTRQGCVLRSTLSNKPTEPTTHIRHLLQGLGHTANKLAGLTHVLQQQNTRFKQLNIVADIISAIRTGKTHLFKCTAALQVEDSEAGLSRVTFRCTNMSSWTLQKDWQLLVQLESMDHKTTGSQAKIAWLQDFRLGSLEEVSLKVKTANLTSQVIVTGALCCQVDRTGVSPGRTGVRRSTGVTPDTWWVGIPVCRKVLEVPECEDSLAQRQVTATSCILDILLQQACH